MLFRSRWGRAFLTFLKSCGLPEGSLGLPLTALWSPHVCHFFSGEETWAWSGPRGGPGLWLSGSELPGSWPVPSLSPLPLTPSCACSPCSPGAVPAAHPAPLLCPQRRSPAAHCQVQRIKITSGKTRGRRSNINLRDPACRPRCPFPSSLPTNMQLLTVSSARGHPSHSWMDTHPQAPAGSAHPPERPRAQVWPAHPDW